MYKKGLIAALGLLAVAWTGSGVASVTVEPAPKAKGGFDRWDKNHDGVLDREEFQKAQRQFRKRAARRQGADAGPAGPGRRRGPRGPGIGAPKGPDLEAMDHHIREIVRQTVEQMWRERQPRIGEMIREVVGHAMREMSERRRGGPRGPGFRGPAGPEFEGLSPLAGPRHDREHRGHAPGMEHGKAMRRPRPFPGPDFQRGGPPPGRLGPGKHKGRRGPDHRRGRDRARGPKASPGPGPAAREGRAPKVGRIFKQHDANGDGFLTPDEFPGGPKRFQRVDQNSDGKITRKELRKAQRRGKRPHADKGDAPPQRRRRLNRKAEL